MTKLFTIIFVLLSITAYSQPVMDGNFDGEAVWGAPKAIADNNTGWASAQAKKFYVTADANYLYLGAEVTASEWMAWAFIINTKPGGATSDSWARRVYYNHPPDSNARPDFTARGQFGLPFGPWAEIYKWTGTSWQRDPDNGLPSTEWGENIGGSLADGWVEIRVPQSILGSPAVGDIQFYITGDNDDHGCFDACPDDDNANSWTDSSTISNYQTNIRFAKTLNIIALIEGFYDGSSMVSDTVSVELRNTISPFNAIESSNVLLNSSGSGITNFYSAQEGINYYITIKHLNSLETWSANTPQFIGGTMSYDFTTAQGQAYGGSQKQKGTKWCLINGDTNQDQYIDGSDYLEIVNYWEAGDPRMPGDTNGDVFIDGSDYLQIVNNFEISSITPLTLKKYAKPIKQNENMNITPRSE